MVFACGRNPRSDNSIIASSELDKEEISWGNVNKSAAALEMVFNRVYTVTG